MVLEHKKNKDRRSPLRPARPQPLSWGLNMALRVNGELVDDAAVRHEENLMRPRLNEAMSGSPPSQIDARVREWARENVIERMLLRQAVASDAEPLPAEALAEAAKQGRPREDVEMELRVERLAARHAGRIAAPRHKDAVDFYRKHRENMTLPEAVRAAHIVKNIGEGAEETVALEAIRAIEEELKNGANFEELADRSSDCPGLGGDLGWFPRGRMVEEFDAVVFTLPVGQLSPIFRTVFGFHIAKVTARRDESLATFEQARPQIEERLMADKKQKALERYLDHLRAHARIEEAESA